LIHEQDPAAVAGDVDAQIALAAHDLAYWNTSTSVWTTPAGSYQILIGDSSRNLPLSGTLTVASTITGAAATADSAAANALPAGTETGTLTVANPHGMSSPLHAGVDWAFAPAASGVSYTATGLPPGLSISSAGVFSGAGSSKGTYTVTVTARNTGGATGSATFVWTVT